MRFERDQVPKCAKNEQPQAEMASVEDGRLKRKSPAQRTEHEARRRNRIDPLGQRDNAEQNNAPSTRESVAGVAVACYT